jgi:hypothetical protein
MQSEPTIVLDPAAKPAEAGARAGERYEAQTPLTVIGLAAIAMILLINSPTLPGWAAPARHFAACENCGTVTAVRRTAHPAPVYFIDVRMPDGSVRTIPQLVGFHVGDVVEVDGDALTLRPSRS